MVKLPLPLCAFSLLLLVPLLAHAAPDLMEKAAVWVSGVRPDLVAVNDRWTGPLALRDGDPATAYYPQTGEPYEIQVRLTAAPQLTLLHSLVITGVVGPLVPTEMEFGGEKVGEPVAVTVGSESTLDLSVFSRPGRLLRLRFPAAPDGGGISSLELTAADGPAPAETPALSAAPWLSGISLTLTLPEGAWYLEVMRTGGEVGEYSFALPPGSTRAVDRPWEGENSYRVRAIGFDGKAGPWGDPVLMDFTPPPAPAPSIRGIVEGFYGRPWTWGERNDLVRFMAALGMNTYLYAPKDDPYHREQWREAYPAVEMEQFQRLLKTGKACGVSIAWCVSPGLTMDPSSEADFEALTARLSPFLELGYTAFGLLLDDIKSPKSGATGILHSELTAKLSGWLPEGSALYFVGTVYAGTAPTLSSDHREYLEALAEIPQSVPIMWTGEGVFDADMAPDHIKEIGKLFGRKPLIWDNYPVNDFALSSQRLFLGPVTGRGEALMAEVEGILSNPMTHQAASRPALLSYGRLLADPAAYVPEHSAQDLELVLDGQVVDEGLELFIKDHSVSPKMQPGAPAQAELSAMVQALLPARSAGGSRDTLVKEAHTLSRALARRYVGDQLVLQQSQRASLSDEMWTTMHRRRAQLEVALESVAFLVSGEHLPSSSVRLADLFARYNPDPLLWLWFALEEPFAELFKTAEKELVARGDEGKADFTASLPTLPDEVEQGTALEANLAAPAGTSLELFGPDGVHSELGMLRWTPSTPGYANLVILYAGSDWVWPRVWRPFVREARSSPDLAVEAAPEEAEPGPGAASGKGSGGCQGCSLRERGEMISRRGACAILALMLALGLRLVRET